MGAVLIGASALLLTGNPFAWHKSEARHAVGFALLTGCVIAGYTIFDKASVASWLIPPLLYDWGCNFFRVFVLVPLAQRRAPGAMAAAWRDRRGAVIAIALGSPLSYILVLTAMVFTPVSLVAPAREVSILTGSRAHSREVTSRAARRTAGLLRELRAGGAERSSCAAGIKGQRARTPFPWSSGPGARPSEAPRRLHSTAMAKSRLLAVSLCFCSRSDSRRRGRVVKGPRPRSLFEIATLRSGLWIPAYAGMTCPVG